MSELPSLTYVRELIDLCKKEGVQRIRLGTVELDLAPQGVSGPDAENMQKLAQALMGGTATDEEMLFASAPQFVPAEKVDEMLKRFSGQE